MNNRLDQIVRSLEPRLSARGIVATFSEGSQSSSFSVNLDSKRYVGTVTQWPESQFEFQFNSCASGNVKVLETQRFESDDKLFAFIENLLFKRLSLVGGIAGNTGLSAAE